MLALTAITALSFCVVAVLAIRLHRRQTSSLSAWAAAMFVALAVVSLSGLIPKEPVTEPKLLISRFAVSLLVFFPLALYQFARHFSARSSTWGSAFSYIATGAIIAGTFAIPSEAAKQMPQPTWIKAFLLLLVAQFMLLSCMAAYKLFRADASMPRVALRRIRLLAWATVTLCVALVFSIASGSGATQSLFLVAVSQLLGIGASVLFILCVAPPRPLRLYWLTPEFEEVQAANRDLWGKTDTAQMIKQVVPQLANTTASRCSGFLDLDGQPVELSGTTPEQIVSPDMLAREVRTEIPEFGFLAIWPDPAPWLFHSDDAMEMLESWAVVVGLALRNARLLHELQNELSLRREAERALMQKSLQLERANLEIEEFVAVASHDLQSPVRNITDWVEFLRKDLGDDTTPRVSEDIDFILKGSARLADLVGGMLTYTKSQSSDAPMRPINANNLVAVVQEQLNSEIVESGTTITLDPLPMVQFDRAQFMRLMTNLIDNAIKYREPSRTSHIHVSAVTNEDSVTFSVRDNGLGVPAEYKEQIFVMFNRLHPDLSISGTGIGLAVCKRIVQIYGGRIWVEDANPGSVFRFEIPTAMARNAVLA